MRIIITGFSGFVAKHFIDYLEEKKIKAEILGIDINQPDYNYKNFSFSKIKFEQVDLLDSGILENVIYSFQPDYLLHLASYSSVGFSWRNPSLAFRNNINIFLNLMEIVRKISPACRILSVGSSEEYGIIDEKNLPLDEKKTTQSGEPLCRRARFTGATIKSIL